MSVVQRSKGIILHPKQEWQSIAAEPTSTGALYGGYIVPPAAIGPVATLIGTAVFGISLPLVGTYRVPLGAAAGYAVVQYVGALIGTVVLALIIDALAPTFAGHKDRIQALKVAAYASTAAWVAGIFAIIPALSIFGLVGLYSLYLLYLGLPVLMKAPQEKAVRHTAVVIICAVVLLFVLGMIAARFAWRPTVGMPGT